MVALLHPSKRLVVLAALGISFAIASQWLGSDRMPQASAETRFVETSESGLAIVPASCPSYPVHYNCQWIGGEVSDWTCNYSYTENCSTPPISVCPSGYVADSSGACVCSPSFFTQCTATVCPNGLSISQYPSCMCPAGQTQSGSACVVVYCPNGLDVSQYPSCTCPAGQVQNGSICETPITDGGDSCTPFYFCQGSDKWYKNSACADSFIEACAWGCAGSACLPPPSPQGNITAVPSLVHAGETSLISWTTEDTITCTVTENNAGINDSWTGLSGSKTSSALTQQTKYTLTCQGQLGATPPSFNDSVTVNIVPIFEEN